MEVDDLALGREGGGVEVADEAVFDEEIAFAGLGPGGVDEGGVPQENLHGGRILGVRAPGRTGERV